jgi:hypothetical protein
MMVWAGCKTETDKPTLQDPNVSYLLDSIVTLDLAYGTEKWYKEYVFEYDQDQLKWITHSKPDPRYINTYHFENGIIVKAIKQTIHSGNSEYIYEYIKDTIRVSRTNEDTTYLQAEYIKPADKITEMYSYWDNGSNMQYSRYNYTDGNVMQSVNYFNDEEQPAFFGYGPYDDMVNPLAIFLIPGRRITYSTNNELWSQFKPTYDSQGRITELYEELTGNHTKYYYRPD